LDELEFGEDYSKVKVTSNQIPIQTFWNHVEPYFRPLTEEDVSWLEQMVGMQCTLESIEILSNLKDDEQSAYVVPPLGKHYFEKWAAEDRALIPGFDTPSKSRRDTNEDLQSNIKTSNDLLEEVFGTMVGPCGPLTERILCALIQEEVVEGSSAAQSDDEEDEKETSISDSKRNQALATHDYEDLEQRLKRELQYIGLIDASEVASVLMHC
jgi:transcriptional adapter 3